MKGMKSACRVFIFKVVQWHRDWHRVEALAFQCTETPANETKRAPPSSQSVRVKTTESNSPNEWFHVVWVLYSQIVPSYLNRSNKWFARDNNEIRPVYNKGWVEAIIDELRLRQSILFRRLALRHILLSCLSSSNTENGIRCPALV